MKNQRGRGRNVERIKTRKKINSGEEEQIKNEKRKWVRRIRQEYGDNEKQKRNMKLRKEERKRAATSHEKVNKGRRKEWKKKRTEGREKERRNSEKTFTKNKRWSAALMNGWPMMVTDYSGLTSRETFLFFLFEKRESDWFGY